jgi:hypothetical protein
MNRFKAKRQRFRRINKRSLKAIRAAGPSAAISPPTPGGGIGLPPSTAEASTPLVEREAQGNNSLDVSQRGAVIGEMIPIVFARRVSGVGGVLISPAATEARFQNSVTNEVTGFYHLVLGEGPMDSLQVRDVFQRSCRVGSFSQTYNKRAGTFIPGNFIVPRSGYTTPECPSYCGTGGTYTGLSTLAFQATYPDGITQWNRQVHCFVRGGLYVTRLLDSVLGPSNNVADLLRYLLRSSSRVPDAQIDAAGSFLAAATFTDVNGFWFNGTINRSSNLRDWVGRNLQYFLLRLVRVAGKESLKPLLPTNANGTIKTTAVDWEFAFTEEHIIPDSFEIDYTPLADRKPFAVMVLWRQQDDLGIPLVRTAEVRYPGTAIDGPFEQHDLSAFCASENHAVKVGTYILSRRNHITHRLRIGVKPDAFNPTLAAGDRVRVRLDRTPSTGAASVHDYLYEVDRIGKSISGEVRLELTHFPVDDTFASVVAKEVNAAVGAGFVLPTGLSGITCDVNSSSDTSIPADTSLDPGDWNIPADGSFDVDVIELDPTDLDDMPSTSIDALAVGGIGGLGGFGGGGGSNAAGGNPEDGGKNNQTIPSTSLPAPTSTGDINNPEVGDTLTTPIICEGGRVRYYRRDPAAPGGKVYLSEGPTYTLVINDVDYSVYSEIECPDPTSPTGYSEPVSGPWLLPVSDGWTRFGETGEFVANRTVNQSITALYNCSGGLIQDATSVVDGPFFFAARNNVVGYKFGGNTSVITYVCPPTPVDTNTVSMGVSVLYADNTSEFIGTYLPNGNRGTQTGTRTEIWTFSITVGGTPIYP